MESPQVRLRALTRTDLPQTLAWHNQADIVDLYAGHPFPVNQEMEQKWYDKILTSNYPTTVFGIELVESPVLIGISILRNIDLLNRCAETAIYIGNTDHRGKGYAGEALLQTLRFGFDRLGLHRIWLSVRADNEAAIKLYKAAGFIEEGLRQDAIYKNGRYYSLKTMASLNPADAAGKQ